MAYYRHTLPDKSILIWYINIHMNTEKQDSAVITVLADIGLTEPEPLTPEQEEILARALDPEKEFLHAVEQLFGKSPEK